MLSCSIWFSATSFWMGGGLESRCVGRVYGADGARHHPLCYSLRPGHSSILPALNFQPAATRKPDGLCGNQRYLREFLMMGIMVPETC